MALPVSSRDLDLVEWIEQASRQIIEIIPEHSPILADAHPKPWARIKWLYRWPRRRTPRTDDMRQMIEDIANATSH